jgi:hypothetical protein
LRFFSLRVLPIPLKLYTPGLAKDGHPQGVFKTINCVLLSQCYPKMKKRLAYCWVLKTGDNRQRVYGGCHD